MVIVSPVPKSMTLIVIRAQFEPPWLVLAYSANTVPVVEIKALLAPLLEPPAVLTITVSFLVAVYVTVLVVAPLYVSLCIMLYSLLKLQFQRADMDYGAKIETLNVKERDAVMCLFFYLSKGRI